MRFPLVIVLIMMMPAMAPAVAAEEAKKYEPLEIREDMWVQQVTENVWRHVSYHELPEFGRVPGNGLVVVGGGEAAMIDTPWTDEQTGALIAWVAERLKAKVTVVIPTHYHGDNMGGLAAAHRAGAASYALDRTVEIARTKGLELPRNSFEKSTVVGLGSIKLHPAYHGGAHTADNIVVWVPSEGVLFGGCAIRSAGAKRLGNVREAVLEEWPGTIASIEKAYPEAQVIVPGHGAPGGRELLQRTRELVAAAGK